MSNRFIVATTSVSLQFGAPCLVLLSDYKFWADHISELVAWCDEHGATTEGMTVNIPSKQVLTLFCLRWS